MHICVHPQELGMRPPSMARCVRTCLLRWRCAAAGRTPAGRIAGGQYFYKTGETCNKACPPPGAWGFSKEGSSNRGSQSALEVKRTEHGLGRCRGAYILLYKSRGPTDRAKILLIGGGPSIARCRLKRQNSAFSLCLAFHGMAV
eukprot:1162131-Pelagomonas_calceolata.AAC.8